MSQTRARFEAFRIVFLITLVLLVIEYVLGMISNLEVQFPRNLPDGNTWGWIWSHSLIIQLYISTATLPLVVALVALWSRVIDASNNDNDRLHYAGEVNIPSPFSTSLMCSSPVSWLAWSS